MNKPARSSKLIGGIGQTRNHSGGAIFEPIQTRIPARRLVWSIAASIVLNLVVLTGIVIVEEIAFARRVSERLGAALQKELRGYRMVLLLPANIPLSVFSKPPSPPARAVRVDPAPLREPDPRLLQRMDPQLLEFVRENPEVENIVTRELVRDIDRKTLDVAKLLEGSSLELSFAVDEQGRVQNRRVVDSSGVPSIDHLALALAGILEKYGLLTPLRGLRQVAFSIRIGDHVEVALDGTLEVGSDSEAIVTQLRTMLTLARFALTTEAAFLLQDVEIKRGDDSVSMKRTYPKLELVAFLSDYFKPKAQPSSGQAPAPLSKQPF